MQKTAGRSAGGSDGRGIPRSPSPGGGRPVYNPGGGTDNDHAFAYGQDHGNMVRSPNGSVLRKGVMEDKFNDELKSSTFYSTA